MFDITSFLRLFEIVTDGQIMYFLPFYSQFLPMTKLKIPKSKIRIKKNNKPSKIEKFGVDF